MGNPYSRNVKRIPARLVKDPTNIAIDWPYGGTPLGVARDIEFRENVAHRPSCGLGAAPARKLLSGRVQVGDGAGRVDAEDGIANRVERRVGRVRHESLNHDGAADGAQPRRGFRP